MDTGKTIALVALSGAVGYGAYKYFTTPNVPLEPGVVEKVSVIYQNSTVSIGQSVKVSITWKNIGQTAIFPQFRVDIEDTALVASPKEGKWKQSPIVQPGQISTIVVSSVQITDWPNGTEFNTYVLLNEVEGHWDTNTNITMVTPIFVAELYTGDYINDSLYYSFRGFQPSSTVTISVDGTSTSINKIADSYGGGDGLFSFISSPGNYTLRATDGQTIATSVFVIPAIVDTFNIFVRVVDAEFVVTGADNWAISYYDPTTGTYIGDGQWHTTWERIEIDSVHSNGFLAGYIVNSAFPDNAIYVTSAPISLTQNYFLAFNAKTGSILYEAS